MLQKMCISRRGRHGENVREQLSGTEGRKEESMKTLRDAEVGETVKVVRLSGEGATKRRIMDMGITRGTEICIRKVAPLGDPVELNVRGYELSVRKADAEKIVIE